MKIKILKANATKGFSFLASINRPINPAHVSIMAESLRYFGDFIRPVVVAKINFLTGIDPAYYVIDGQHLYMAAFRLKLDIPYQEIEVKDLEDLIEKIAKLNSTSKTWALDDYINTWAYYKPAYQEFKTIYATYNLERSLLAELLHTGLVSVRSSGGSIPMSRVIKRGQLKILNKAIAIKILDYVMDLRDIINDLGRQEQRLLISIMIEKIKADGGSYDHKAYIKYLQGIRTELMLASHDLETLRNLLSK